jgi:hypothetical protein
VHLVGLFTELVTMHGTYNVKLAIDVSKPIGPIFDGPETSVAKYQSTLRHITIVKALFNGCLFNDDLTTSSYSVECSRVCQQ